MGLVRAGRVDTGSVNLGGTGPDGLPPASEFVYTNTFAKIALRDAGVHRRAASVRASRSSSPASCRSCSRTHAQGALPPGTLVKFYFAGGGYLGGGDPLWGSPPIIEALDLFLAMLGDTPVAWAVAVLGGSLLDTPIARAALERGGHLRVGLEDWDDGPAERRAGRRPRSRCATKSAAPSPRSPRPSSAPETLASVGFGGGARA